MGDYVTDMKFRKDLRIRFGNWIKDKPHYLSAESICRGLDINLETLLHFLDDTYFRVNLLPGSKVTIFPVFYFQNSKSEWIAGEEIGERHILLPCDLVELTTRTPPPTDAHRERVRGALGELRAEAERLATRYSDDAMFLASTVLFHTPGCVIELANNQLLRAELATLDLELNDELHWTAAHDAIARANGCKTIAELEAKTPPSPQPEVAVAERDREFLAWLDKRTFGIHAHEGRWSDDVLKAIADHMATERAEAEAWETAAKANADALAEKITQLAATEAKLREAEVLLDKWADVHQAMSQKIESAAWDAIGTRGTVPRRPHPQPTNAE